MIPAFLSFDTECDLILFYSSNTFAVTEAVPFTVTASVALYAVVPVVCILS